ncbi:MAG: PRC-barrel domain-containing protein [Firmicutes bacterium]|nr:PRC-barrel domain-containing protein [Bacillota bacterium]
MTEEKEKDRTSKSMIGMPLYSIQEGIPLGLIKQILISGKNKAVEGFLVEKRRFSREEKILPFPAVSGFGEDTLTVERQTLLERKGQNQQFLQAIRSPLPIIGARVFTAGGKTLGKVEEYRFSVEDGRISGLEIAGDGFFRVRSLVDGSCIIAIAPRTIMLKDEALETAVALENSFVLGMETAAAAVLEKASDIKSNASEAGRKLSANFNEAMGRLKLRSEEGDRELAEALGLEVELPDMDDLGATEEEAQQEERKAEREQ